MPTKTAKALGKKIKQARIDLGVTQADLAYRMGISAQSISAFESGRIQPALSHLEKIAQFTHKPLYFFTGQKVNEALDRIDKALAELNSIRELLSQIIEDGSD